VQDKSEAEIQQFVKILQEKTGLSWKGKHQQIWAIGAEDKITNVKGFIEAAGVKAMSCGKIQGKEEFCMAYDARHFNQRLLETIVCSTAVPSPGKKE
jgi:hypothetical protein